MIAWIVLGAFGLAGLTGIYATLRKARAAAALRADEARRQAVLDQGKAAAALKEALAGRRGTWEGELRALKTAAAEREQRLDRLVAKVDAQEQALAERERALEAERATLSGHESGFQKLHAEIARLGAAQKDALLTQVGMGAEEAAQACLRQLEAAVRHESEVRWDRAVRQVEEDAEQEGRRALHIVMGRIRTRQTLESQQNVVTLKPEVVTRWFTTSPELRAKLSELTRTEITIEPEGDVRFSAYDGVSRETAKIVMMESVRRPGLTVETLPAMVQEQDAILTRSLAKIARRFLEGMRLRDIHPDVVRAMGRLRFRTSYGQNILEHSVEAGYIASQLASEAGLDPKLAMRCGLLHDLGKALTTEDGGMHDDLGAELAKRCGEPEAVILAIDGHHGANNNLYTKLAMAGDAISGARPGARRETYEKYVERIEQLQAIASSFPEVQSVATMKAGREIRVQTAPQGLTDEEVTALAQRIADQIEEKVIFPGEIHVTAIKETKVVEYAR